MTKVSKVSQLWRIQNILFPSDDWFLSARPRQKNQSLYSKVDELFSFFRQNDVEAEVSLAGAINLYSKDLEGLSTVDCEWFQ